MQEALRLVFRYLNGIWRFRWVALVIAVVTWPIGWLYVASLPDQYVSSARVYVDTDSVLRDLLAGLAIQTNERRRVELMTRIMFTNETMEKLARMSDLDLRAKTPAQMEALVGQLKRRVQLRGQGRNEYRIAFKDTSPELAKRVVQSMLTIFVESNLGATRQDQDAAEQFLQREIKEYERRMFEVENELKLFKLRNLDLVTEKGDYYQRLRSVKDAHEAAKEKLALAVSFRDEVQVQLKQVEEENADLLDEQYKAWLEEAAKAATAPYDARIAEVESQIDNLLLRYTDAHPEIFALRATLERIKLRRVEERDEFLAVQNAGSGKAQFAENPMYQEMRLRLSAAEAEVATHQGYVENLASQADQLQRRVDEVLRVEAEEARLTRDLGAMKSKHGALVSRLEKARFTRQVDTSGDTVRFRILDPPQVPTKPSGPNRVGLSFSIFVGAMAAGIGIALGLALLRPVFDDRRQLNEAVGLPVLGSVNMILSPRQSQRRRVINLAFGAAAVLLMLSFGLGLAVFYLDIHTIARFTI